MTAFSEPPIAQLPQSSPLLRRIDRRRTESVGVVNVEQFQAQYAQIPSWIVQRSALLSQIHTRYNSQTETAGQEQNLVFSPSQPVPSSAVLAAMRSPNSRSSNSLVQPTLPAASSLSGHPNSSPSSSRPTFRISRKPVPVPSPPSDAQIKSAQPPAHAPLKPFNSEIAPQSPTPTDSTHSPANLSIIQPQNSPSSGEASSSKTAFPTARETPSSSLASQQSAQPLILPKQSHPSALAPDGKDLIHSL